MEEKIVCNNTDALKIELRKPNRIVIILEGLTSDLREGGGVADEARPFYFGRRIGPHESPE